MLLSGFRSGLSLKLEFTRKFPFLSEPGSVGLDPGLNELGPDPGLNELGPDQGSDEVDLDLGSDELDRILVQVQVQVEWKCIRVYMD